MEILFVADAMTGQDAVKSAEQFHKRLGITGVILTKMDGDARGGAALSIRQVTGRPLKFVGVGEKPSAFELFYPERVVSRILGMGDMLSFIEKVEGTIDEKMPGPTDGTENPGPSGTLPLPMPGPTDGTENPGPSGALPLPMPGPTDGTENPGRMYRGRGSGAVGSAGVSWSSWGVRMRR